ncbi:hypothetical protein [Pseudoalteromonas virus vB_PspP-H6/1]|nr:hypothetical protein [Pseudoalteromonas virus vB_PspP-H6/1]
MILGQWGLLGVFGGEAPPETIGFFLNLETNLFNVTGLRQSFKKPLPLNGQDSYTLMIDKDWLAGEEIESFDAACSGVSITPLVANDNILQFAMNGVSTGDHEVTFNWATATRSGAYSSGITVTG